MAVLNPPMVTNSWWSIYLNQLTLFSSKCIPLCSKSNSSTHLVLLQVYITLFKIKQFNSPCSPPSVYHSVQNQTVQLTLFSSKCIPLCSKSNSSTHLVLLQVYITLFKIKQFNSPCSPPSVYHSVQNQTVQLTLFSSKCISLCSKSNSSTHLVLLQVYITLFKIKQFNSPCSPPSVYHSVQNQTVQLTLFSSKSIPLCSKSNSSTHLVLLQVYTTLFKIKQFNSPCSPPSVYHSVQNQTVQLTLFSSKSIPLCSKSNSSTHLVLLQVYTTLFKIKHEQFNSLCSPPSVYHSAQNQTVQLTLFSSKCIPLCSKSNSSTHLVLLQVYTTLFKIKQFNSPCSPPSVYHSVQNQTWTVQLTLFSSKCIPLCSKSNMNSSTHFVLLQVYTTLFKIKQFNSPCSPPSVYHSVQNQTVQLTLFSSKCIPLCSKSNMNSSTHLVLLQVYTTLFKIKQFNSPCSPPSVYHSVQNQTWTVQLTLFSSKSIPLCSKSNSSTHLVLLQVYTTLFKIKQFNWPCSPPSVYHSVQNQTVQLTLFSSKCIPLCSKSNSSTHLVLLQVYTTLFKIKQFNSPWSPPSVYHSVQNQTVQLTLFSSKCIPLCSKSNMNSSTHFVLLQVYTTLFKIKQFNSPCSPPSVYHYVQNQTVQLTLFSSKCIPLCSKSNSSTHLVLLQVYTTLFKIKHEQFNSPCSPPSVYHSVQNQTWTVQLTLFSSKCIPLCSKSNSSTHLVLLQVYTTMFKIKQFNSPCSPPSVYHSVQNQTVQLTLFSSKCIPLCSKSNSSTHLVLLQVYTTLFKIKHEQFNSPCSPPSVYHSVQNQTVQLTLFSSKCIPLCSKSNMNSSTHLVLLQEYTTLFKIKQFNSPCSPPSVYHSVQNQTVQLTLFSSKCIPLCSKSNSSTHLVLLQVYTTLFKIKQFNWPCSPPSVYHSVQNQTVQLTLFSSKCIPLCSKSNSSTHLVLLQVYTTLFKIKQFNSPWSPPSVYHSVQNQTVQLTLFSSKCIPLCSKSNSSTHLVLLQVYTILFKIKQFNSPCSPPSVYHSVQNQTWTVQRRGDPPRLWGTGLRCATRFSDCCGCPHWYSVCDKQKRSKFYLYQAAVTIEISILLICFCSFD